MDTVLLTFQYVPELKKKQTIASVVPRSCSLILNAADRIVVARWINCLKLKLALFHCFIVSLFHCFIVSLFHCFIVSLFHCFIVSLFHCFPKLAPLCPERLSLTAGNADEDLCLHCFNLTTRLFSDIPSIPRVDDFSKTVNQPGWAHKVGSSTTNTHMFHTKPSHMENSACKVGIRVFLECPFWTHWILYRKLQFEHTSLDVVYNISGFEYFYWCLSQTFGCAHLISLVI